MTADLSKTPPGTPGPQHPPDRGPRHPQPTRPGQGPFLPPDPPPLPPNAPPPSGDALLAVLLAAIRTGKARR